jgi:circadian clock protein KaiB
MAEGDESTKQEMERAVKAREQERYVLRLYVAGMSPRSSDAIVRVTRFLEQNLADRYELEIVDIYQKPALLRGEQIVAVPTLIKKLPAPLRRMIGDMHDSDKLFFGLDLKPNREDASTRAEDSDEKEP